MKTSIEKVVVTGVGFIGLHLVEAVVQRDVDTVVVENLSFG